MSAYLAGILLILAAVSACERKGPGQQHPQQQVAGAVAADFALKDLSGQTVRLSDFRGKAVFLEFWATWCPPCRTTVPELVALTNRYQGKAFVVIGVAMDEGGDAAERIASFVAGEKVNYMILRGTEEVGRAYNVHGIPAGFLIGKDGMIIDTYVGYIENFQSLVSAQVDKIL